MKKTIHLLTSLLSLCLLVHSGTLIAATPERDETIIQGVNYVGITVSNLEQAAAFYQAGSDLEFVEESTFDADIAEALLEEPNTAIKTQLYRGVNAQLRFMEFVEPEGESAAGLSVLPVPVNGPGIAHICFQVADATQSYQHFVEAGATPIGNPELVQLNARNPVTYAYATDPDGIMIEVEHIDFSQISRPRKNDYRIRHVSLATGDMERIVAFYSVLLEEPDPRRAGIGGTLGGDTFDQVSGFPGTQMEMAWFQVRNLELEIVQYYSHPPVEQDYPRPLSALGYNMMMFDAVDLSAARALVESAGGRVITENLSMDGGEVFFARDPDHNLIGIQSVSSSNPFSSRNFADNGT